MQISNHRLVASSPDERVEYREDEHYVTLKPEIAVIHYAVTESSRATAATLSAADYLSCHVTVDPAGHVIQQVPFNRRAYHCGSSSYRGRASVNTFSLGIEVSNPGPLIRQPDGSLKTTYGKTWIGEAIEARHKSGVAPKSWTHWAEYTQMELDVCAQICDLWRREYGITDIVGHDDVSPGRKFDPGPAFPLQWLREAVFGSNYAKMNP